MGKVHSDVQISKARYVEKLEDQKRPGDWKKSLNIPEEFAAYREPLLKMLAEFWSMWDVPLRMNNVAKEPIELNSPYVRPIHSVPFRAGPADQLFYKEEFETMTKMGIRWPR